MRPASPETPARRLGCAVPAYTQVVCKGPGCVRANAQTAPLGQPRIPIQGCRGRTPGSGANFLCCASQYIAGCGPGGVVPAAASTAQSPQSYAPLGQAIPRSRGQGGALAGP